MDKIYSLTCSECGEKSGVMKSIFHDMGLYGYGSANCPHCNIKLNIIYDPEKDSMSSRNYELFIQEIEKEKSVSKGGN